MKSIGIVGAASLVPATALGALTPTGKKIRFAFVDKILNRLIPKRPFELGETVFVCGLKCDYGRKELVVLAEECEIISIDGKGKDVEYAIGSKVNGNIYVDVNFQQTEYVRRTFDESQRKGVESLEKRQAYGRTQGIQDGIDKALASGFKPVAGGLVTEKMALV